VHVTLNTLKLCKWIFCGFRYGFCYVCKVELSWSKWIGGLWIRQWRWSIGFGCTRGGKKRTWWKKKHNVKAKLACFNNGEQGVVLVCKGDRCSRSRVGSNSRAEWKLEEKRWKIKTYKLVASIVEWGGMGRNGAMCNNWFGRSSNSLSNYFRLGMERDAKY
jgi:hypothetical protein